MSEPDGAGTPVCLSLVAAVYNERENLAEFLAEADAALKKLQRTCEILCVDDGSRDGSRELLLELKGKHPALRVIALDRNHGQSAAFAAGVQFARGQYIALIDADLQNDPADLAKLLAVLEGPAAPACVAGRRAVRQDNWLRRGSSRIANRVRIWITGDPVRDTGCSLKLFRAEYLRRVKFFRGLHRFLTTLIRLEGGTVAEVDVSHRPRARGQPKYGQGLGRTFTALRDALAVRWMQRRALPFKAKEL
jgi:glycosyltransferase involved in cell wall biosynthesis